MMLTRIPGARTAATAALVLTLAWVVGCESRTEETAATAEQEAQAEFPETVQTALAIAKELKADPDGGEAILERHGLDLESFEDLMYEISSDPLLSEAYNRALETSE